MSKKVSKKDKIRLSIGSKIIVRHLETSAEKNYIKSWISSYFLLSLKKYSRRNSYRRTFNEAVYKICQLNGCERFSKVRQYNDDAKAAYKAAYGNYYRKASTIRIVIFALLSVLFWLLFSFWGYPDSLAGNITLSCSAIFLFLVSFTFTDMFDPSYK